MRCNRSNELTMFLGFYYTCCCMIPAADLGSANLPSTYQHMEHLTAFVSPKITFKMYGRKHLGEI